MPAFFVSEAQLLRRAILIWLLSKAKLLAIPHGRASASQWKSCEPGLSTFICKDSMCFAFTDTTLS
jgi:hypothetical protein